MKILVIQENGRNEINRNFRECLSLQRAFRILQHNCDVWGLGHDNYEKVPDWNSYDLIINLENYDEKGWVPDLSSVHKPKFLWSIDAHVKGLTPYLDEADRGRYDLILQATKDFVTSNSVWLPNCYDNIVIKPSGFIKLVDVGFCGFINNRGPLIDTLARNFNFKLDFNTLGQNMVDAISSYKIHFNCNIRNDINYRNFETMGCKTVLLTSNNPHYKSLGFEDGVNCLIYSSLEEMVEKARELLKDNDRIFNMAEAGYNLVKEKHTYVERAKEILGLL